MPVDPDISQPTAGGGYRPGYNPDYDPDEVSSRPKSKKQKKREIEDRYDRTMDNFIDSAGPNGPSKLQTAKTVASMSAQLLSHPKTVLGAQLKRTLAQANMPAGKRASSKDFSGLRPGKRKFNPREDSPFPGGDAGNKDRKKKKGAGVSGTAGSQAAQEQSGKSRDFPYKFPSAAGGGAAGGAGKAGSLGGAGAAAGGAKGAGAGKGAGINPQEVQEGLSKVGQHIAKGDFKGAAKEGLQDAATIAAEVGEGRAFLFLVTWALPTLGLSLVIGGTALLIANMFVNKKAGTHISMPFYQKAVILLLDALWALILFLILIVSVASFCYALTSPSYAARLGALIVSPGTAIPGEVGRYILPTEVSNFCSSITGNAASSGQGTASGTIRGPGGSGSGGGRCQPATSPSPATVENLASSCFGQYGPDVVRQASIVAQAESNGDPSLPVGARSCGKGKPLARCVGGEIPVWGLYQINLIVHKVDGLDCPSAFRTTSGGRHNGRFCNAGNQCVVVDPVLYDKCAKAAVNVEKNTKVACELYRISIAANRPGWWDWGNINNEHGIRCGF